MPQLNKVIIAGNVTRDPVIRYTPKGTAIAQLGLALNRVWKTESGEQKEEVTFIDVSFFGKQGETVAQYFKKGAPMIVEGRLRMESWEDKETKAKRQKLVVVGEGFSFCGEAKGGKAATAPAAEVPTSSEATGDEVAF